MTGLAIAWPPAPIRTERLLLRQPEARDRAAVIEAIDRRCCALRVTRRG